MAIADDALQAALMLTNKFVTDRAQPDKSIDVLDEACAHAQATAHLPAELEVIVKERRKVDAAIRRRLARGEKPDGRDGQDGQDAQDPIENFAREIGPTLERIGAELGRSSATLIARARPTRRSDRPTVRPSDRPTPRPGRRNRSPPAATGSTRNCAAVSSSSAWW